VTLYRVIRFHLANLLNILSGCCAPGKSSSGSCPRPRRF
jgi:hypothetical protein